MKGSCLAADKFCEFAFPSDRATYLLPYPLKVNATVNQLQPTVGALIGTIVSVFGIVLVEMLVYLVFKCLRDSRLEDRKENQGFLVFEKATQNCTKREEMSKIQRLVESSCQTSAMKSQVSEAGADQAKPQIVYNAATGKAYPVIPAQI
uniref:Uncharacterized protein n=1 Tax=Panagrolaimus sp. JU765 TaxID=591449 RepID=A0AC34QX39_9BILA